MEPLLTSVDMLVNMPPTMCPWQLLQPVLWVARLIHYIVPWDVFWPVQMSALTRPLLRAVMSCSGIALQKHRLAYDLDSMRPYREPLSSEIGTRKLEIVVSKKTYTPVYFQCEVIHELLLLELCSVFPAPTLEL